MCKKSILLILVACKLAIVNCADAGVIMQCDVGGCGVLQRGWTVIDTCGTTTDAGGTGIDVTLATGKPAACDCRKPGEPGARPGPLQDVERDFLFANDQIGSPDGDFIITFSNLTPGVEYWLFSYHNHPDSEPKLSHIEGVRVTGATNVTKPGRIDQDHPIMEHPAIILFTASSGTVSIRYLAPTRDEAGKGAQAFLNGFILGSGLPTSMSFESASSSGFESGSPAELAVALEFPEPGQTYTVDYAVTGGTATGGGVDYTLEPGVLTFNPGETRKVISIDTVDDGLDETGETIMVTLSNPTSTGAGLELGEPNEHTYTILDSRPAVGFETDNGIGREDIIPAGITVNLAFASDKTITVDYSVTGGSATGGGVDYTLEPGTLTFEPGQRSKSISLELVHDSVAEGPETIVITLSNPTNAVLTAISQITYTILDSTQVIPVGWWKFDEGSGSTARDSSGNNFHGSIQGDTEWVEGHVGSGALSFTRGYVVIDDNPKLRPSRVTVCAWINLDGLQSDYARLLEKGDDNNESYVLVMWQGKITFGLRDAGLGQHNVTSKSNIPQYEWVFVAGVYDGSNIIVYINGEVDNSSVEGSFTPANSSGEVLAMGALPPAFDRRFLGAAVDDVRIYDRALSAEEIRDLYVWKGGNTNEAALPNPKHLAEDVYPYVTMSWLPGKTAVWHDVYLGTDYDAVNNATTGSSEFMGNVDVNSYDAGLLEFEQTYYWRIDEVNDPQTWKGKVWQFTVEDGKARNPRPSDHALLVPLDATVNWTPGTLSTSHDVYFGTDETAVADATAASDEFKGHQDANSFEPGILTNQTTYYWRIDEYGDTTYVRGDVWQFTTAPPAGALHLKVDLALPQWDAREEPRPGTAKEGWWPWVAQRWADMYSHDCVWEHDYQLPDGIDGTGIHAMLSCGYEGQAGLHAKDLCRGNLAGDSPPGGVVVGDPIANTWLYAVDWAGFQAGDIVLVLTDLPAGEYLLFSYHNHWEPGPGQGSRNCCRCMSPMPPMPSITAQPLPPGPECKPPGKDLYRGLCICGTGTGVEAIEDAYNVPVTYTNFDDEVSMSVIRFRTNGSEVLVIYEAPDMGFPDCARPGREGGRAILNAFELVSAAAMECPCIGDLNADEQVDLEDLQGLAGFLLDAGSPFVVPVEAGHCGDLNSDLQLDLEDLQGVAGILLQAGSPFVVPCP